MTYLIYKKVYTKYLKIFLEEAGNFQNKNSMHYNSTNNKKGI